MKRGLLIATPSTHDGRGVEISLSRSGIKCVARAYAEVERALLPSIETLSVVERARLHGLLRRTLAGGKDEQ